MKIGQNIKHLRKAHRITQEQLGVYLNRQGGIVSVWERGEAIPRPELIDDIAHLFAVTPTQLAENEPTEWAKPNLEAIKVAHEKLERQPFRRMHLENPPAAIIPEYTGPGRPAQDELIRILTKQINEKSAYIRKLEQDNMELANIVAGTISPGTQITSAAN
ncbi:MAG: helix-turn-helix domain-containing protein [Bernardetiaceae bacterium]|jgi:transcriptional regulator with XRE-family HTH domain|nr:helix-turn-helix domain-containing protein [Bernardetiaceae bacterium]